MASCSRLTTFFETPIQRVCTLAGLVDGRGRGTITAHRFRHTVGTQLAERGAKLHTHHACARPHQHLDGHGVCPGRRSRGLTRLPGRTRTGAQPSLVPRPKSSAMVGCQLARWQLSEDQLLQDRKLELGYCLRLPTRRRVRVRPLSHLREVRHHASLCSTLAGTTQVELELADDAHFTRAGHARLSDTCVPHNASNIFSPSSASHLTTFPSIRTRPFDVSR